MDEGINPYRLTAPGSVAKVAFIKVDKGPSANGTIKSRFTPGFPKNVLESLAFQKSENLVQLVSPI